MKNKIIIFIFLCCVSYESYPQLLYKISGNQLHKPSYVLGTHHLAPIAILDSIINITEAIDKSERLIGEVNMTAGQSEIIRVTQPFMMAPSDSTLSQLYSEQDFRCLSEKFDNYSIIPGVSLLMLERFKPIVIQQMVLLSVMQKKIPGYVPDEQLDLSLQKYFIEHDKPVIGLETIEEQAELLYSYIPIGFQSEILKDMLLDNIDELYKDADLINDAYFRGNLDDLISLIEKEDTNPISRSFTSKLINERNTKWLKEINNLIREQPSFIVVGAAHLPGKTGLLQGLREEGFIVEPY